MKEDENDLLAYFVAIILGPFILMWLWNACIPEIFGVSKIGFWSAMGLLLISDILFKK